MLQRRLYEARVALTLFSQRRIKVLASTAALAKRVRGQLGFLSISHAFEPLDLRCSAVVRVLGCILLGVV